ncbi:carbohydrate ABC transporter permease [Paenibacillus hunanensis]|uniref:ABC-type sugar transport system permease subunit n=1 Tax=Paenibacillus hunanensis TaxID=539262 RepID=A0ABU1J1Y9_9BACL|nr:sugar ABC transporter permease [Paenibacillus hunanensis]MCL9662750.1 sugar ABC transporter permease [Paenibacillus hunanensis]MDR6245419.1 ABC-type sugar transport system permease subunit [Paenibacillus hunanensis]WPP43453.1 sugar ABC transporter permease [Paenibacillus hunanensis]GGJ27500.1 ABC transporter permease [Paenibacillus hunanensis]
MNKRTAYLFIFPSVFLTLVLGVYPLLWALRYMFYNYQGYGDPIFVGFGNFARLLRDAEFWQSVVNTGIYAAGKLIVTIPLSLILAFILNRKLRGRTVLRAIYYLPTVFSASVMSIVFFIIFNSYNGVLNQFLLKFHIIGAPISWLGPDYAMLTTIMIAIWGAVGNYMLLFLAGLQGIPEDLYEAASLDGASEVRKLWSITIPLLGPVMQMIIMLAITISLKGYESIMVLTEGGPYGKTEVMYLYLFKLLFPVSPEAPVQQQLGYGSAVGFVTAIIVGIVTILYFYLSRKLNKMY